MENKEQKIILNEFINFYEFYGIPYELGTDNGSECINPSAINYLNKNNIKSVNGRPYNTRSQGAIERIYIAIRNYF